MFPVQSVILDEHVFVLLGHVFVDPKQMLSIGTSTSTPAAGLDPKDIIENGADEVVVEVKPGLCELPGI